MIQENIKWFYKNGESSSDYFSIVYVDAVNHKWNFYPDFIVCDANNNIWVIETKGGENAQGESKNIDIKVENKLYLCNTEYTEDMGNDNWKLLDNIF